MNESVEFQVITDLTPIANTTLETNAEQVKTWLTEQVAPYRTMVVSEEGMAAAKNIRANIRKVKAAIDSQRRAVKKEFMRPYENFDKVCKELTGILDEGDSNIDSQVKAIEQERKDAKLGRLKAIFDEESASVSSYLSWERIQNPRWANAGFREEDAAEEIRAAIRQTSEDLDFISALHSPFELTLLDEYARTGSLRDVLSKDKALRARQEAAEKRIAEEAGKDTAARENAPERVSAPSMAPADYAPPPPCVPMEEPEPKRYRLRFEVAVTAEQAHALKDFFAINGIAYKKI